MLKSKEVARIIVSAREGREISEGVVLDYDARGNLVGIDIDNASSKPEIQKLVVSKRPASVETGAG